MIEESVVAACSVNDAATFSTFRGIGMGSEGGVAVDSCGGTTASMEWTDCTPETNEDVTHTIAEVGATMVAT